MKITGLHTKRTDWGVAACATVTWEDAARRTREVFFETDRQHADAVQANPDAFLAGAFVPAMRHGEQRIAIEGSACPVLADNLRTAALVLRSWYGPSHTCPRLEPEQWETRMPVSPPRAGLFLSGGIDSVSMLRVNRRCYPRRHPASFRDAFFVYGFDMAGIRGVDREGLYREGLDRLAPVAREAELDLIPVRTNVRHLDDNYAFHRLEFTSAILAAVSLAFSGRISSVSLASSICPETLVPYGTHPVLDPLFSSSALQFRHEGLGLHRLQKARDVVEWPTALENLRVCFNHPIPEGEVNCGLCDKCMRSALEIVAAGGDLSHVQTLPFDDLTASDVKKGATIDDPHNYLFMLDLPAPLREAGREDLARALESSLRLCRLRLMCRRPPLRALRRLLSVVRATWARLRRRSR